ncbi:MAG: hypothetical protein Kow0098_02330 [Ignavibacteriaceae bacterium]
MSNSNLNYLNFTKDELDELFQNSKQGHTESFNKLSAFIRQISYSYFLSKQRQGKILNIEDVDDLTNNVYLAFAEQFQNVENLEFWLRRVLFLNFVNWYKKSKTRKTFTLIEATYLKNPDNDPAVNIDAEKIIANLNLLSEEKQMILKMRFWEDLKFSEIAEQMNKSEDAVKKMFYRTITELKKML